MTRRTATEEPEEAGAWRAFVLGSVVSLSGFWGPVTLALWWWLG